MSRYDAFSSFAQTKDYSIKVRPNTEFEGTLDRVFATSPGDYGQSVGVGFSDVVLTDGVLLARDTDEHKLKLFSWDEFTKKAGIDTDATPDDVPAEFTETHIQGTTDYVLVGARRGGDVITGEGADPADPIDVGPVVVFEGGDGKPSASAKALASTLTKQGKDVYGDLDNIMSWISRDAALRPALKGKRVKFAKVEKQGPKNIYHSPTLIDTATMTPIIASTGDSDDSDDTASSGASSASTPSTPAVEVEADSDGDATADPLMEFIGTMGVLGADDAAVEAQLQSMVSSPSNGLTAEAVEAFGGVDAVKTAISG